MFGRNKNRTAGQVEEKKFQTIFSKKAKATHPVSAQPVKSQTEYTYTLLPNKERSKQRKIDKAKVGLLKKRKTHKVDMEDLPYFCQIGIGEIFSPECKASCVILDREIKKLEKDLLDAFCDFLRYWKNHIGFIKLRSMKGWTNDNFVKFCEEVSNLFDEFFLLPEKYKLLVRELVKAIYEKGKKFNGEEYSFHNMFIYLSAILSHFTKQPECDIFNDNDNNDRKVDNIISLLKNGNLKKFWPDYGLSKKKLKAILDSINIPNDKKEIEVKLERLANSAFDKNSNFYQESFAERMKRVMEKFSFLRPTDIESKNKALWETIRGRLIKNDFFDISCVAVGGCAVPKEDSRAVARLLGITPQNMDIFRLQKCNDVRVFSDSEMRRNLFVTMALFVVCLNDSPNNSKVLLDFFKQLTKEERFEIMHSDLQHYRGCQFPLLLIFLLQDRLRDITIDLIRDFVPEVFKIRFRIDESLMTSDIIGLLKEVKGFCNKKLKDEYVTKEEEFLCKKLLGDRGVEYTISQLKEIKKQHALEPKPWSEQKSRSEIERAPSTKIGMGGGREYEISDCCLVNLFRCVAAKFR